MTKAKDYAKKAPKGKIAAPKFSKREYNAPLKYKINKESVDKRKVELTVHRHESSGKIVNVMSNETKEKKVSVTMKIFDDGNKNSF